MKKKEDWVLIKEGIESFSRVEDITNIIVIGEKGGCRNIVRD